MSDELSTGIGQTLLLLRSFYTEEVLLYAREGTSRSGEPSRTWSVARLATPTAERDAQVPLGSRHLLRGTYFPEATTQGGKP